MFTVTSSVMSNGPRVFVQALVVGVLSTGLLVLTTGACADSPETASTPPGEVPRPSTTQGQDTPAPVAAQPLKAGECEELGALTGTALRANMIEESESFLLPLVNRPVPSRLGVTAVGEPLAELAGQTVALGVGSNDNYGTCSHCIAIALDCGTDCSTATWFYPRSGSARFNSVGAKFEGTFSDVVLEQVTLDWETMKSTRVAAGACFHISELSFVAEIEADTNSEKSDAGVGTVRLEDAGIRSTSSSGSTSGASGTSGGGHVARDDLKAL